MFSKKLGMVAVFLLAVGCGVQEDANTGSTLDALYAESSIGSLRFAAEGGRVYLAEGNRVLPWAHSAPTQAGNKVQYAGRTIGDIQTGYLCNGPYDAVCDASLYKSRPSSITIKQTGAIGASPVNPSQVRYITANTAALQNIQVGTPVGGIAKGSCNVSTSSGSKRLSLTVERKKATGSNGQALEMIEVKTPVYQYNPSSGSLQYTRMKTLQRVYSNGAVQNVEASTASQGTEVQGLLRLFQM
ncbi:hypothetical protein [Pseudobacteriovorax antillogorgiicola]|uniref:Lipoprotein n=1 Tax=Pseudobacteriovorax antillogorgiicola TaxID=1513793 RepID=A0A1Y6BYF4_9BACT|nr:hypothetical protein [Pseudobacteriovorax antillogorgiicola]TCS52984.1 hypothetical protein EDD56_10835 [Pseudobacteriovorax antillogorgiicola]SMF27351.1 hypothetical protein SAMN06296036_108212 [Pseudobacteriovorax antillogorgiicola]